MYGVEVSNQVSSAKVILHSRGPNGVNLFTLRLRYPRIIHSELLTHRVLSRSTASSRAVPTKIALQILRENPAKFVSWGKNKSGMSAEEDIDEEKSILADLLWSELREHTIQTVEALQGLGVHKQLANRPLEPFSNITCVVTATEWSNLEALRRDINAQPEFRNLANQMQECLDKSAPNLLDSGELHLPFVTGGEDEEELRSKLGPSELSACSVARCARETYGNSLAQKSWEEELRVYQTLFDNGHMSPFEHVAQACDAEAWKAYAELAAKRWIEDRVPVGNLWGWVQLRKTKVNEHDFSLR